MPTNADIMLCTDTLAWRMLGRADRFEAAIGTHGKSSAELCEAISASSSACLGTFRYLLIGGEEGTDSEDTKSSP